MALIWVAVAFLSGSIPISLWLGKWLLRKDIRQFGDGNPGGTNLLRAGGLPLGLLGMILEALKAALPVGLAYFTAGLSPAWMLFVSLAPLFGHAYSPFLRGQGGKAVGAAFGVWTGLTLGEAPILLGIQAAVWSLVFYGGSWPFLLSLFGLGVYLFVYHPHPLLLAVWVGNLLFSLWRHRSDLSHLPVFKPFLLRILKPLSFKARPPR